MNYGTMSVHDLVRLLSDNMADVLTGNQHGPPVYEADVESALRRAVIREASVGTLDLRTKIINEHPLLVKRQAEILPDNLPYALYDLIPHKEKT
jgi:hypothetical protein